MPVPLSAAASGLSADAGENAPIAPFLGNETVSSDVPPLMSKEGALVIDALLRPLENPPLARGAEVNTGQLEMARRKVEMRLKIALGASRMRVRLEGSGFLLPDGVELRARADRLGYIVLYAGGARYRTLAPGSLRSFFSEGRYDNVPLRSARTQPQAQVGYRLGYVTRVVETSTDRGKISLELAKMADTSEAGPLVCRMLLEFVGASPAQNPCAELEVPLRAEVRWKGRGGFVYEVAKLNRSTELSALALACPPASAESSLFELPIADSRSLLSESELAQFQSIQDVPFAADAPRGLLLSNHTDLAQHVWIDGVPVARVAAQRILMLSGLQRGKYTLQWRSALGEKVEGPFTVVVPGKSELGAVETQAQGPR
jgi:hypothetical protein